MLLANREVAMYINRERGGQNEIPIFIYRIHDLPDVEKISDLAAFVKTLGYDLPIENSQVKGTDINALFKQIEGKPQEEMIKTAGVRSMAKAIYSTKNIGHFGLAFRYYTHFTSPIRRYPDMLAHRILASHLDGKPITRAEYSNLERQCITASEAEAKAVDAERDSIRYKLVEYMSTKIGQTFEAVISGVTDWGLYIEEKESSAEGLVRIRTIGNEFFTYMPKEYALVGQKTKKKYALGDRVRVKLVAADVTSRQLDFELAR
jgi:ribonuclease R